MTTRDAIDEIVDWQLRKKYGTAVRRFMFHIIDNEEIISYKLARWTPTHGWIKPNEDDMERD